MRRGLGRFRWVGALAFAAVSLSLVGQTAKKGEVATGTVTGTVTCADTNAPARFAVVTLEAVAGQAAGSKKGIYGEPAMNATATTGLDGRFVMEKISAGRYYVLGSLSGYLNPLAEFDDQQLHAMSVDTKKELASRVPIVDVEPGQGASITLRLEHASEVSGTVLYDDGSPAVGLRVQLLSKQLDGKLADVKSELIEGLSVFGSRTFTDDRGVYKLIGTPPGEYTVRAALPQMIVSVGGLLSGAGANIGARNGEGGDSSVFFGNVFRGKQAKTVKVGHGEQVGGVDITIPVDGLHSIHGTVVAKTDDHPLSRAHVELLYTDDREVMRSVDVHDEDGGFAFSYVPNGQYVLRLSGAADVEEVAHHEFNSNWTDDRATKKYGVAEMPVIVQDDVTGLALEAPEAAAQKVAQQ